MHQHLAYMLQSTTEAHYSTVTQLSILCRQLSILCRQLSRIVASFTTYTSLEYSFGLTLYLGSVQLQIKSTIDVMTDATHTHYQCLLSMQPSSDNSAHATRTSKPNCRLHIPSQLRLELSNSDYIRLPGCQHWMRNFQV